MLSSSLALPPQPVERLAKKRLRAAESNAGTSIGTTVNARPNRPLASISQPFAHARIHALVGYGSHGQHERIQNLLCQARHTKVTVRRGTPLYRLKTPSHWIGQVLSALAEGLDVPAAVRVLGHAEATIHTGG